MKPYHISGYVDRTH